MFKSGVVFPESKTSSCQLPTPTLKRKTIKLFLHQQKEVEKVVVKPSFDAFQSEKAVFKFLRCNVHGP